MKVLKILGIIILSIVILAVGVLGYFGFVPGVSAVFGSDKPRDLGVPHTAEDLENGQAKLGQDFVDPSGDPYEQLKNSKASPVNSQLTSAEYAAHIERVHPIDDVQVKFTGDKVEVSGRISRSRIPAFARTLGVTEASDGEIIEAVDKYLPTDSIFYISGTASSNNNEMSVNLDKAELGRFPVAPELANEALDAYLEFIIDQTPSLTTNEVKIEDGMLHFDGTATAQLPKY